MLTMRWYASAALSYWPNSISESPSVPQFQGSSGELEINAREYSATLVKLWRSNSIWLRKRSAS